MPETNEGGCLCGAVRYVTHGDPMLVTVCHCTWCQRRTGSAFAVGPVFKREQIDIVGGSLGHYRCSSDESGRWLETDFCPACGTNIGFTLEWRPDARVINAGTFDDPGWISPDEHQFRYIFLRSAQRWSEVPGGARVHQGLFD